MAHHPDQVVKLLTEVSYGFDARGPKYTTSHAGSYSTETLVDPAPCYAHDYALVEHELKHLQTMAPLNAPLAIQLLSHEAVSRVNGWCELAQRYIGETCDPVHIITLSGKRIPLHPAMTRYLVSHEYGHAVNNYIVKKRGITDAEFDATYTSDFRPDALLSYGCNKWHTNVGEMIANDFRILVARRELEFWPHPGFQRPESLPKLVDFWAEIQTDLQEECDTNE